MNTAHLADEAAASARAWYALGIVIVAVLFGVVDRQILVLVTAPLKQQMALSDAQIGVLLGIGPGIFSSAAAIGFGWLADRAARQHVLAVCVLLWSVATAAFGFAHDFLQLLLATAAVGLGEAAVGPIFYTMVPDLFPGRNRTVANLIYFCAVTTGAGIGLALSGALIGWIGDHRGGLPPELSALPTWRLAFLVVALPGLPIAAAVTAIGRIRRTGASTKASPLPGLVAYLRDNAMSVGGLCASISCYGVAAFATYAWIAPYIIRDFGVTPAWAGYGVGEAFVFGSIAGVLLAGALAKRLSRQYGLMTPVRLYESSMLLASVPLLLQLVATSSREACVLLGIQMTFVTFGTALTPTLLQDISPAPLRGRVIALLTFAYSLVSAVSPVLVGGLSDELSSVSRGLLLALLAVSLPALLGAFVFVRAIEQPLARTIQAYSPSAGA